MCAYSTINGEFACQNDYLMKTTLDQRMGIPRVRHLGLPGHSFDGAVGGRGHGSGDARAPVLRASAPGRGAVRPGQHGNPERHGQPDPDRDVPLQRVQQPADGLDHAPPSPPRQIRLSRPRSPRRAPCCSRTSATRCRCAPTGGGTIAVIGPAASAAPDRHRRRQRVRDLAVQCHAAAGHPGGRRPGHDGQLLPGPPRPTPRCTPIPSADLTPAYVATGYGGTYTGTLTAPETGTYVLAFQNPGSYTVTNLSLDGHEILANPGTPPVSTYSVAVDLQAGQTYTLRLSGGGPSANLSWATPSDTRPGYCAGRQRR